MSKALAAVRRAEEQIEGCPCQAVDAGDDSQRTVEGQNVMALIQLKICGDEQAKIEIRKSRNRA